MYHFMFGTRVLNNFYFFSKDNSIVKEIFFEILIINIGRFFQLETSNRMRPFATSYIVSFCKNEER